MYRFLSLKTRLLRLVFWVSERISWPQQHGGDGTPPIPGLDTVVQPLRCSPPSRPGDGQSGAAPADCPGAREDADDQGSTQDDDEVLDELDSDDEENSSDPPPRQDRWPGGGIVQRPLSILSLFEDSSKRLRYVYLNARFRPTDAALFHGFQGKYHRVSSPWKRFIALRQVTAIRFVQVRLDAFIFSHSKQHDCLTFDTL